MDAVEWSSIVFVLFLAFGGWLRPNESGTRTAIAIALTIANYFQFGYFSGLFAFTGVAIGYIVALVILGIVAAAQAYTDVRDA